MNDKSPAADTTGLKQATQHRPSGGHVHHSTRRDLGVCRATRVRVILALGVSFSPVQVASLLARAFNVGAGQPDEIEMAYRAGYAEDTGRWLPSRTRRGRPSRSSGPPRTTGRSTKWPNDDARTPRPSRW